MASPSDSSRDGAGAAEPGDGPQPAGGTPAPRPSEGPKPFPNTGGMGLPADKQPRRPRPDQPPKSKPSTRDPSDTQPSADSQPKGAAAATKTAASKIPGVKHAAGAAGAAKAAKNVGKAFTKTGRSELADKGRDAARQAGSVLKQKAKQAAKQAAKKATKTVVKKGAHLVATKLTACLASLVCGIILGVALLLVGLFIVLNVIVVFGGGVDVNLDTGDPAERQSDSAYRERTADVEALPEAWHLTNDSGPDPVDVLSRWIRVASPPDHLVATVDTHNNPDLACERLLDVYEPDEDQDLDTKEQILEELTETGETQQCSRWWAAAVAWSHALREATHGMGDNALGSLLDIETMSDDAVWSLLDIGAGDPIRDLLIAAMNPTPSEITAPGASAEALPYEVVHDYDAASAMVVALWAASGFATPHDPTDGFVQLYYGSLAQTDDDTYRRYRSIRAGRAPTIALEDSEDLIQRAAAVAGGRARENEAKHRAAVAEWHSYLNKLTRALARLLVDQYFYPTPEAKQEAYLFYIANPHIMLSELAELAARRGSHVEPVQDFGCCEAQFFRGEESPIVPPLERPPSFAQWPPYCGDPGGLSQLPPTPPTAASQAAMAAAGSDETLAALLSDKVLMAVECQMPPSLDTCWQRPAESTHWQFGVLAEDLSALCTQIKAAEDEHAESGDPGWLIWHAKWDRNGTLGSTIYNCVPGTAPGAARGAWVLTYCANRVWVGQAGHAVVAYGVYHTSTGWTPPPPRPPSFGQLLASVINPAANESANVPLAQHAFALANLNGWVPEYGITASQRNALTTGDPGDITCLRLFRVLGSGVPDSSDPSTRPVEDPNECHEPTRTQMALWGWGPPQSAACPKPQPLSRFEAGEVVVTDVSVPHIITVAPCMAPAMIRLYDNARSMSVSLPVVSSYRTWEEQSDKHQGFTEGGGTDAGLAPVAEPGHSRHNMGLALDFACNIALSDTNGDGNATEAVMPLCWRWLDYYAYRYGLINFPVEEWHWSVDGR